jgi:leucyl/phenylalanyl-tRNA--protein transferase
MPLFVLSDGSVEFPPVRAAEAEGLLAVGGDLSVPRLVEAYKRGIFPWYDASSPILWWSPHPRCVLLPENLHVPKSLDKILASNRFDFTVNKAFSEVIRHCAQADRPGQDGTWITTEVIQAYTAMHKAGFAHSVEVWENGKLSGGLYGIALGKVFFGESMFYLRPNASKAAVVWWVRRLQNLGFKIIDCQQATDHMLRFGAQLMDREEFVKVIAEAVAL